MLWRTRCAAGRPSSVGPAEPMPASRSRTAIGRDPLDLVVPGYRPTAPVADSAQQGGKKVRATFHISADLLDELRDAVVALSGPPTRFTLAGLAEQALVRELDDLRRRHNGGQAFPSRSAALRVGRPIS